ncbi:TPA: hypothetical protein ACS7XC_002341 [Providencia alcalifaciens]|uniref:hypothetical protein n=1 Tax=Providencia alcalifaciens TaxID=126385 RepID=UPI001D16E83E|nr:hypothetical protein [Providencia alcalifaciens]
MTTLDFNLVSIIKNAGRDPTDVTDAVWNAGYQKMNFTTEEIIQMTTSQIADCFIMASHKMYGQQQLKTSAKEI